MSNRTMSPSSRIAARWARVPPIIPAPISAIFLRAMRLTVSSAVLGAPRTGAAIGGALDRQSGWATGRRGAAAALNRPKCSVWSHSDERGNPSYAADFVRGVNSAPEESQRSKKLLPVALPQSRCRNDRRRRSANAVTIERDGLHQVAPRRCVAAQRWHRPDVITTCAIASAIDSGRATATPRTALSADLCHPLPPQPRLRYVYRGNSIYVVDPTTYAITRVIDALPLIQPLSTEPPDRSAALFRNCARSSAETERRVRK